MKSTGKVGTIQYTLLTSRTNRRITIRVGHDGMLTIRAPKRVSKRTIEKLITEHKEHLLSRIDEEARDAHTYEDGDRFPYAGTLVTLQVRTGATNRAHIKDDLLVVSSQNPRDKDRILRLIKALYRKEAEKRIKPLVEHWSRILGVSTPRFTIRDSKKRWGSCSKAGRLNFSLRSQALGDEELSYLVLHEVAHLLHFDHSKEFKTILQTHMNDYKIRQKRMFAMQRTSQLIR
jgi:predicted metal-dependent hydrolase